MSKLGTDIIGSSGVAPFFKVANPEGLGINAPQNR